MKIYDLIRYVINFLTSWCRKKNKKVSNNIDSNNISEFKNMPSIDNDSKENEPFKTNEKVDNPTSDNNEEKKLLAEINKIEKPNLTDCCSCKSFIIQFIFFAAVLVIILCLKDNYELIYYVLTIYFVLCLIYSLYSLLACKYEYRAYMKDKELSNDLKKLFYQGKINRILKNK